MSLHCTLIIFNSTLYGSFSNAQLNGFLSMEISFLLALKPEKHYWDSHLNSEIITFANLCGSEDLAFHFSFSIIGSI